MSITLDALRRYAVARSLFTPTLGRPIERLGYVSGTAPREADFGHALAEELARLRSFLALPAI